MPINIPKNINDVIGAAWNQFRFTRFVQDLYTWMHQVIALNPAANIVPSIVTVTNTYTVKATDCIVQVDTTAHSFIVTLPAITSAFNGFYIIKRIAGAGAVVISCNGGSEPFYIVIGANLQVQGDMVMFYPDLSTGLWRVISLFHQD